MAPRKTPSRVQRTEEQTYLRPARPRGIVDSSRAAASEDASPTASARTFRRRGGTAHADPTPAASAADTRLDAPTGDASATSDEG